MDSTEAKTILERIYKDDDIRLIIYNRIGLDYISREIDRIENLKYIHIIEYTESILEYVVDDALIALAKGKFNV